MTSPVSPTELPDRRWSLTESRSRPPVETQPPSDRLQNESSGPSGDLDSLSRLPRVNVNSVILQGHGKHRIIIQFLGSSFHLNPEVPETDSTHSPLLVSTSDVPPHLPLDRPTRSQGVCPSHLFPNSSTTGKHDVGSPTLDVSTWSRVPSHLLPPPPTQVPSTPLSSTPGGYWTCPGRKIGLLPPSPRGLPKRTSASTTVPHVPSSETVDTPTGPRVPQPGSPSSVDGIRSSLSCSCILVDE